MVEWQMLCGCVMWMIVDLGLLCVCVLSVIVGVARVMLVIEGVV